MDMVAIFDLGEKESRICGADTALIQNYKEVGFLIYFLSDSHNIVLLNISAFKICKSTICKSGFLAI